MFKPLDIPGLADFFGISEETVRLRVKQREWPCHRLGKLVRFTDEDVETILAGGFQPALVGPLAKRRLSPVELGHPPAGPRPTPPPPPRPRGERAA